jgi:hypothetical protein
MKKILALIALLLAAPALAQNVQYSGTITRNQIPVWVTPGVIGAGTSAADSPISSIGVTNEGGAGFCVSSQRQTAVGRNQLCLSASTTGPATISVQNYGTAAPQPLQYVINGTIVTIPTGGGSFLFGNPPFTTGDVPCFVNTTGLLQDCGLAVNSGTITTGVWNGTPIAVASGGTGSNNPASARAALGLGSVATQNANAVAFTGGTATGFPTPVNASDVAIKSYVDASSSGLNILAPSRLATATVLPNTPTYANGTLGVGATLTAGSNTTLTVDGTTANLNDVVLVKNQVSTFQNGIYQVTTAGGGVPWVLTRATYFDTAAKMKVGSYTFVTAGSANINASYTLQSTVVTVGTDALTFVQFSAGNAGTVTSATIAAGTGISVTGTCTITTSGTCTIASTGVTSVTGGVGLLGGAITTTGTLSVDPTIINSQGGRLTLVSGQPYMSADCVGCQTIYLAPDNGQFVPVYNGSAWTLNCFLSGGTCPAADNVGISLGLGGSASWPANSIFDVFAVINSGSLVLATRAWDASMLPTTSQISNNTTITTGTTPTAWTRPTAAFDGIVVKSGTTSATVAANAGLANCLGQNFGSPQIVTSTTVTAPTDHFVMGNIGVMDIRTYASSDGTNFYLMSLNWINDAAMGAAYTLPILLGNQQPYQYWRTCFDRDPYVVTPGFNVWIAQIQYNTTTAPVTRRLTHYGGILVNDASMTARVSSSTTITTGQYQGTYLGSFQTDAASAGQVSVYFSYGPSRTFNLWNAYRQVDIVQQAGIVADTTTAYTLTNQLFSPCENSTFSVVPFVGLAQQPVTAQVQRAVFMNTGSPSAPASYEVGIGVDTITAISGTDASTNFDTTGMAHGLPVVSNIVLPPYFGTHTLTCIERSGDGSSGGSVQLFNGVRETFLQARYKG